MYVCMYVGEDNNHIGRNGMARIFYVLVEYGIASEEVWKWWYGVNVLYLVMRCL
jgi:hypothetical protein